jgi:hypothetical protein
MTIRRRFVIGFAAAALLTASTRPLYAAFLDSNLAISPATQANGGGCYPVSIQPSLLDMLTLVDPEWAAIDVGSHLPPLSDPITVHGTVARAKVNETGDFPASHLTYDQNTFVTVDAAEMGLIGTGNVSAHGVEAGNMEVELEYGKYPLFAWGGTGDRFTGVGRWIWDCGHPDPDPAGTCSVTTSQACNIDSDCKPPVCPGCVGGETCGGTNFTYHSELHVPQAIAVSRVNQGYGFSKQVRSGRRAATRTDVWISSDLGGAGDLCPITHHPNTLDLLFTVQCFPLSQPIANVNANDFEFDIPLPPRPPESATLAPQVRVFERTPKNLPKARVTTTFVDGPTPVEHAVIHMSQPTSKGMPSSVGKTILARWPFDTTPLTRLRVDVTAIEIVNPLKLVTPVVAGKRRCSVTTAQDCSTMPCPSGESCMTLGGLTPGWQMFLEVNGDWREAASLSTVALPNTLVAQRLRYELALPATGALHLHTSGKSLACLESQLYGRSLGDDIALYGLTDGANCLADQSHDAGSIDVTFTGPDFGSGTGVASYVTQVPDGEGGHCSATTSQLCVADADCPGGETCVETGGSFKLHYTITKL